MSINIIAIPLALAMYTIMGKEEFERFVSSQFINFPINRNIDVSILREVVTSAGFDFTEVFGIYKTHLSNRRFFTWDWNKDHFEASFPRDCDKDIIVQVINKITACSKYKIFETKNIINEFEYHLNDIVSQEFPTIYKDLNILISVLKSYGYDIVSFSNNGFKVKIGELYIEFYQRDDFSTIMRVPKIISSDQIQILKRMTPRFEKKYRKYLQIETIEKIKHEARKRNWSIESQNIMKDGTVVITINAE